MSRSESALECNCTDYPGRIVERLRPSTGKLILGEWFTLLPTSCRNKWPTLLHLVIIANGPVQRWSSIRAAEGAISRKPWKQVMLEVDPQWTVLDGLLHSYEEGPVRCHLMRVRWAKWRLGETALFVLHLPTIEPPATDFVAGGQRICLWPFPFFVSSTPTRRIGKGLVDKHQAPV